MFSKILLFMLLVLLAAPTPAAAHPHVWIDIEVTPVFNAKGLSGFRQQWFFDEMFSVNLLAEALGEPKDTLSPDDVRTVKAYGFDNLANFNYFTDIRVEGRPFKVQYVKDFSCKLQDGMLVYTFFVPCHVTAVATPKKVAIAVYDPTYYSEIYPSECLAAEQPAGAPFSASCTDAEFTDVTLDVVYQPPRGYEVKFTRP